MIRILLVDDQNIVRQGIKTLLEPRPNLQVVGVAVSANSAIELVNTLMPDIVVMDIEMPGISGIIATRQICQQFPQIKVLVLSSHENEECLIQALQAGAQGYLLKSSLLEDLEQAIWSVHRGHSQIESKLLRKVVAGLSSSNSAISSKQNEFISVAKQSSKLETNINSKERFTSNTSVEFSESDNRDHHTTTENLQDVVNKSLPKRNKTISLKPIAKPTISKTEKLKPEKPIKVDKTSLIDSGTWLNKKLIIIPTLLIIMVVSFLYHSRSQSTSTPAQTKKVKILPVKTVKIELVKSYQTSTTYTGEVTASRTTEVGFGRTGKLVEIFVQEGDFVSTDAPIARLDDANLRAQRQGLIAQKEQEAAVLAELKNGARIEEISAAQAAVRDLEQQLELEKLRNSRREYLFYEGAIAREQLDEIAFNRKALKERLANAQSNLNELQNGTRVEQISAQQAALDQLTAEIKDLDITIDRSFLKSPFNSIVSARNFDEGAVVEAGTPIMRLVENTQPKVKIGIPIDIVSRMELGSKQQVNIGGKDYSAVVASVLPEVDTTTRTRTLVLKLVNTTPTQVSLKHIARLNISQTNHTDGYWLPITALVKGDRGSWSCYALKSFSDGSKKAERRHLEILETQENLVLVRGTLQPDDEIILDGTHRLVPGQIVRKE